MKAKPQTIDDYLAPLSNEKRAALAALAAEPALLRRAYVALAGHLRAAQAGLPAQLPGLWHV